VKGGGGELVGFLIKREELFGVHIWGLGTNTGFYSLYLSLADDRFLVVARYIVVADTVVVKVVKDGQTVLIALSVVRLGSVGTTSVGPLVGGGSSARRPSDCGTTTMVDTTTSPEIFLTFSGNQVCEMIFLGRVVKRNRLHINTTTERSTGTVSK